MSIHQKELIDGKVWYRCGYCGTLVPSKGQLGAHVTLKHSMALEETKQKIIKAGQYYAERRRGKA